ncbi:hypothetical protein [Streptomyces atratus]|uniref:hypothetical protein n=1 Tax=Streptomyces atratus TaxID=1893 RepID=UPI0022586C5C|nr:hypothetical protein [Streptomyces atratus]MCX5338581.1 hypothetical protein [Streptomyces atratus]
MRCASPRRSRPDDARIKASTSPASRAAKRVSAGPRRHGRPASHRTTSTLRPDLDVVPIRGNVPGRAARIKGPGAVDTVVLAAAGLHRLGLSDQISQYLDPTVYPPSPGQGALGIQVRADSEAAELLAGIGDVTVDSAVRGGSLPGPEVGNAGTQPRPTLTVC